MKEVEVPGRALKHSAAPLKFAASMRVASGNLAKHGWAGLVGLLLLLCGVVVQATAADDPNLTAADVLRAVREGQGSRHEALNGKLRNDETGDVFPFKLVADGPTVRYEFTGKMPTVIQVRYNDDGSQLEEASGGNTTKLTPANFDKTILGTDMTYEDLALRFVYWPKATLLGEETVDLRSAWKMRVDAPNHRTDYSSVNLWVDKESGALLKAEAYNWDGKLVKRFKVDSGQKLEGKWYLKEMRIESLDPASGKAKSRSYLNITGLVK